MDFSQIIQILGIIIPVIGGAGSIIAAIATYRNISASSRNESRRLDLEEVRISHQETQEEVNIMERIQQMSMTIAERQSQQNQLLKQEMQQLKSELLSIKQEHDLLTNKFKIFIAELEVLVFDFRKKPIEEQNCECLIKEICSSIDKIRKQNGFHH